VASAERSGVLVLRVWIETGAEPGLRARILHEQQLGSGERASLTASAVDEIVEIVSRWLRQFADDGV